MIAGHCLTLRFHWIHWTFFWIMALTFLTLDKTRHKSWQLLSFLKTSSVFSGPGHVEQLRLRICGTRGFASYNWVGGRVFAAKMVWRFEFEADPSQKLGQSFSPFPRNCNLNNIWRPQTLSHVQPFFTSGYGLQQQQIQSCWVFQQLISFGRFGARQVCTNRAPVWGQPLAFKILMNPSTSTVHNGWGYGATSLGILLQWWHLGWHEITWEWLPGCQKLIKMDISDISHSMGNCHDIRCNYMIHFSYLFILFLNRFVKCIHHECSTMNEPKAAHDSQIRVAEAGERAFFAKCPGPAVAIKRRNCEHCWWNG